MISNVPTGTLYVTNRIDIATNVLYTGGKIIYLDENFNDLVPDGIVMASILLPPYQALEQLIDGNEAMFAEKYYEYLESQEPNSFLLLIVLCLFKGINIVMYNPRELGEDLDFWPVLEAYIFAKFGIRIGTDQTQFAINISYIPIIMRELFLFGYIDLNEFLTVYTIDIPLDEQVVQKMMYILQPVLPRYLPIDCMNYCVTYRNLFKENSNNPPKMLFKKG